MKLIYQLGYKYFHMPWDMGPREELVQLVENGSINPCKAIDLGCGTGSNAVFLAQHGFDVTGVDFASSAIEKAKEKGNTAKVEVDFVVDDLTNLRDINSTFDFLVDYGALDDLTPNNRDRYVKNILLLTHPGSRFLLWCFEWPLRWWERLARLISIGAMSLEPGEVDKRFNKYFLIERIAGNRKPDYNKLGTRLIKLIELISGTKKSWPPGFAAYLMTRK